MLRGSNLFKHINISFVFDTAKEFLYILVANIFYVSAAQFFFIGNNIVAGGFTGLATIVTRFVPLSVGNLVFIFNIPLIILSFKLFGKKYTFKVFVSSTMFTLFANLVDHMPIATTDKFAAAVFGGVLYAIGAVLTLYSNTSVGGTDLVARLLLKYNPNLSLGKTFFIVDGFIVILAIGVFKNIEAGVYAITAIVICSLVTDHIITGFNYADICYVITKVNNDKMAIEIMETLGIGITRQVTIGMHSGQEKFLYMIVIRPKQFYKVKEIILKHDSEAFLVVAWASEVMGGGFMNIKA